MSHLMIPTLSPESYARAHTHLSHETNNKKASTTMLPGNRNTAVVSLYKPRHRAKVRHGAKVRIDLPTLAKCKPMGTKRDDCPACNPGKHRKDRP